jgi:hypothetical protein
MFSETPLELDDSGVEEQQSRLELNEQGEEGEFETGEMPSAETRPGEAAPTGRRRHRRRRGRRGVTREDAFLGIERLSTEDIVGREGPASDAASTAGRADMDETILREEGITIGEEITSVEIGGETENGESEEREYPEMAPKRRRRRRRGRRSREPADGAQQGEGEGEGEGTETGESDERAPRRARNEQVRAGEGENDDDDDDRDDETRSNKNLHREVTPWAEAIGFIVNANMEARGRSGGDGGRGRWGKGRS